MLRGRENLLHKRNRLVRIPIYPFLVIVFILTLPLNAYTQGRLSVSLVDGETNLPLPYAHFCFEDQVNGKQNYIIGDASGKLETELRFPVVLAVSVIGYQTWIDTLRQAGTYTIKLKPAFYNMDEVVVTAQMSPKRSDKSIYPVKVINSRLIAEKAAVNLSDLLSSELNLRISKDGALGSSMSINGLTGEHVKILIDGVPVIGRLNGNIDLSQLNLNNVDHIEIVEGPMSVQYGSNALAGAINIITKENLRNRTLLSVNSYYESVGIYNGDLSANLNLQNHSFSLSGGRNFFGGFSRPDTSRTKLWKPREQIFSDFYYVYRKNNLKIRLDGKYFNETIQNKGEIRGKYEIWALDNYFYTDRYTAKAQISGKTGKNASFDLMGSWLGYSRIKNTFRKDLTTLREKISADGSLQDTTEFSAILSRGSFSWEPDDLPFALQTGFDLNYENGEGKRILNESQSMGDYAVFLTTQVNPVNSLSLQPGVRLAYNTRYRAPIVPSMNLKFSPQKNLNLRFSYVRGFRAPSLKELYLYFVDINHDVRGNPDLKAESSHNFNGSLQYDLEVGADRAGAELNFFSNIVNRKIDLINDTGTIYSYANINDFRSVGYNAKVKYNLHPRLIVSLGIARTGIYSSIAGLHRKLENFIWSNDIAGEFRYDLFNHGMSLSAFYKYNGRYPYYYRLSEDDIALGYMDAYNSLDISITKAVLKKSLILGVGGKNLFNITNIPRAGAGSGVHSGGDSSSPVGWGRTFFVSLNYKFGTF